MDRDEAIVTFLCICGEYIVMKRGAIFTCEHCGERYKVDVRIHRFNETNLEWVEMEND